MQKLWNDDFKFQVPNSTQKSEDHKPQTEVISG